MMPGSSSPQNQAFYGQQQPAWSAGPRGPGGGDGAREGRDADRGRRIFGLSLWLVGILIGVVLNVLFTLLEILASKHPEQAASATLIGAALAFPPLVVYLFIPAVIDRFDPEPWWCLAMAFLWGALVATGLACTVNTTVDVVATSAFGKAGGNFLATVVSAPLSEEFFKGICVFGFFFFLRREFDGVVDGIIYATFCALGFAAVENVSYYARAAAKGQDVLVGTFFLRGILAPWGHPLYTSMTGIGFGIAREAESAALRWLAPIGMFIVGVGLHATWNLVPTVFGSGVFFVSLILWFFFVAAFVALLVALVVRKGRTIRAYLRDEVLIGTITQDDVDLICSPVGRLRCLFSWRGATGRRFIRASARLALSKWHTARAIKGKRGTISADFVAPLRDEVRALRAALLGMDPRRPRPASLAR